MRRLPIHVRLTAYYLLSLGIIVTLFAVGSWYAMKKSMYDAVDRDLNYRMRAVVPFLKSHSLNTPEEFTRTFENSPDSSIVGVFVQITDAKPAVLYQSEVLASHHVPVFSAPDADGTISWDVANEKGWTVRVASKRVTVEGVVLNVHVVEPLTDLLGALHELTMYLSLLILVALLLATVAGYGISRRALAPVERLRQEAEAIDPTDLTTRLHVPSGKDELGRLARTLNSMLSRIEAGFRSVERFTADASHELRAPLAFIITTGEVSLRRERSSEELTETVSKIAGEARRMSKLVENLLMLARGDAQRDNVNDEAVDLIALLSEVREQMAPAAAAKKLQLRTIIPSINVRVHGIGSELRSLFLILLDNAIKYTDVGGVDVTLKLDQTHVIITVFDTGIGIGPSDLPHIFDRFWRADKVRSRAEGGAGLGLSLAVQIVQRYHGTIGVDSVLGSGTSFIVKFPRKK